MGVDRTTRDWSEKYGEPGVRINIKITAPSDIDVSEHVKAIKILLKYLENPNQIPMDLSA